MDQEAMFVSMVCSTHREPMVLKFQRNGADFIAVGASKQRAGSVIPPGDGGPTTGSFGTTPDYPGCAYCGSDGFVRCGRCHELSCHDTSWEVFNCPRCGNSGPVRGHIDSISGMGAS
ncbi:Com family DNA-binding transcriptional regulator [Paractinoplanes lichenicola]|uniref:Com family DNA-binding transcriptional regulator n=1 Tax=Paractinoplanes lichenicola TaxID=2802976 RepID=A0ABS1VU61_9ACTN|nr:Com family DNA-binding transcriptional regulator [Actinoplanes lichenicola]MBL7258022.1 Com family DNA-binding transcriptional regulator [Actinoplanes lichenicola]